MSLVEKIKKNSKVKETSLLSQSKYFNEKDMISTPIPALNVALSGLVSGGFVPGITQFCGPSKHFKSLFQLILAKSYMDKYPDAVLIFYDCEFGTPLAYFDSLKMDKDRILHIPIMNMEEFKFDVISQLENLTRNDHVFIAVDSIGNMSSKKELDDAIDSKSTADMTRAKQLKSIFRMITPYLNKLDIPMSVVNHVYSSQNSLYPQTIVSSGTGIYLSSDTVFIIGRQQEKTGTDVTGYNFVINVDKSRYVREKSKIPITVSFDGGISRWSGLLDMALESGHCVKPSNGWYSRVNMETGEVEEKKWRIKDTDTKEFMMPIVTSKSFNEFIENKYKVSKIDLIQDEELDEEIDELIEATE